MGRIERGYESKFRFLLRQVNGSKLEWRVNRLLARANRLAREEHLSPSQALERTSRRLRKSLARWRRRAGQLSSSARVVKVDTHSPRFLCDAGLGGLARWLRAAGYVARWIPDIDDDELLREALAQAEIVITTDSMLMERRILRDGTISALWVPPSLKVFEQLRSVLDELSLPLREPRCMECGGALQKVDKQALRERIPPRTYLWLNDYFLCARCGKLFWHGTHWQSIQAKLQKLRFD